MNLTFDWKYSLEQMPKKNQNIVAVYHGSLIKGKFQGEDYIWDYGKDNPVLGLIGCMFLMKQTITFGSQCIFDLPLTGFYWDIPSFEFNLPTT